MVYSSKMHLGSTFDPVKYEQLQEEAEKNYDADTKLQTVREDVPSSRKRRRFKIGLPNSMKRLGTKAMSFVSRIGLRKRQSGNEETTNDQDKNTELSIPSMEAITGDIIFERTKAEDNPTVAVDLDGNLSRDATQNGGEDLDGNLSGYASQSGGEDLDDLGIRHRYKHQLPCEEAKPLIAKGLVQKRARLLEPHFTGAKSSHSPMVSENCTVPENFQKSMAALDEVKFFAFEPSLTGQKLQVKNSGLTESSDEGQGEGSQLVKQSAECKPTQATITHSRELSEIRQDGVEDGEKQEEVKNEDQTLGFKSARAKGQKRVHFAEDHKPSASKSALTCGAVSAETSTCGKDVKASPPLETGVSDEEKIHRIKKRRERVRQIRQNRIQRRESISQSQENKATSDVRKESRDEPPATECAGEALKWARERAAASADAKIFRRKEGLLSL